MTQKYDVVLNAQPEQSFGTLVLSETGDELFGVVISQYDRMDLHGKKQEDGHKDEISE